MSNGVPTFPERDYSPEVLAHMDRVDRWHETHDGPMPREWDEPAAKPERARAAAEPRQARARATRTRSR